MVVGAMALKGVAAVAAAGAVSKLFLFFFKLSARC
jgi:hypothetical protein